MTDRSMGLLLLWLSLMSCRRCRQAGRVSGWGSDVMSCQTVRPYPAEIPTLRSKHFFFLGGGGGQVANKIPTIHSHQSREYDGRWGTVIVKIEKHEANPSRLDGDPGRSMACRWGPAYNTIRSRFTNTEGKGEGGRKKKRGLSQCSYTHALIVQSFRVMSVFSPRVSSSLNPVLTRRPLAWARDRLPMSCPDEHEIEKA